MSEYIIKWESLLGTTIKNPEQFSKGDLDCKNGLPCRSEDDSYLMGYGARYQLEQILS